MERIRDHVIIENARIIFRNFKGEATKFNREGNRNFSVVLEDEELVRKLTADGWNVKILAPRDESEEATYILQVTVSYKLDPPRIVLISSNNRTELTEETVDILDYAEIENVDLTISPYNWEVNGKTGVKAYLKNMYVTIYSDPLADKYAL